MQVLTNTPNLVRRQTEDPFSAEIRSGLGGNETDDTSKAGARPHNDEVPRETDAEAETKSKVSDDGTREADSDGMAETEAKDVDDAAVEVNGEGRSSTELGKDNGGVEQAVDTDKVAIERTVSEEVLQKYSLGDKGVIWFPPKDEKPPLAVPAAMLPDVLALVHT